MSTAKALLRKKCTAQMLTLEKKSQMNNISSHLKNPGKEDKINTRQAGGRKSMRLKIKQTKK